MESVVKDFSFFSGKRVLITGHTGFKGSWLTRMLVQAGADVTGYSLPPPTTPNLFSLIGVQERMTSVIGDVRDVQSLSKTFQQFEPEIVLHLAAQPLVRESYNNPRATYETNVMGTVNVLECVRHASSVKSVLNVTTDKVYQNREWVWGYRENEPLDGYDPYSNSKSCSELVTHSYRASFFSGRNLPVSTARAGNVIGGGDFSADRIIPDCIRAQLAHREIGVRNPHSTRPYQHVLEPLVAYLTIVQEQWERPELSGYYNVGPNEEDCVTTADLVSLFCKKWGDGAAWRDRSEFNAPHEANFLKLDCSLIKKTFGWHPHWHIEQAIEQVCTWTKVWLAEGDIPGEMDRQIALYLQN